MESNANEINPKPLQMKVQRNKSVRHFSLLNLSIWSSNLKWYLGGKSVSVINNWHAIISIPTVQFNTSAALQKHLVHKKEESGSTSCCNEQWNECFTHLTVKLNRGLPFKLVPSQISIVRRLNVVIRQGMLQFLWVHLRFLNVWGKVILIHQEPGQDEEFRMYQGSLIFKADM